MNIDWLARGNGRTLIVFCNGWGMDRYPLTGLAVDSFDLVILSDYHRLDGAASVRRALPDYRRCFLICWSMGVWAGQRLFAGDYERFTRRIAINGTVHPIDDRYGIPREIFAATRHDFSPSTRDRFYRRMCKEPGVYSFFQAHFPRRELADQQRELAVLQEAVEQPLAGPPIYTDVLISRRDLIIPTRNQQAFWETGNIIEIDGCHYPFSRWRRWSDILDLVGFHDHG